MYIKQVKKRNTYYYYKFSSNIYRISIRTIFDDREFMRNKIPKYLEDAPKDVRDSFNKDINGGNMFNAFGRYVSAYNRADLERWSEAIAEKKDYSPADYVLEYNPKPSGKKSLVELGHVSARLGDTVYIALNRRLKHWMACHDILNGTWSTSVHTSSGKKIGDIIEVSECFRFVNVKVNLCKIKYDVLDKDISYIYKDRSTWHRNFVRDVVKVFLLEDFYWKCRGDERL